ncbi:MAG TPA: hypothetical protein PLI03_11370, partial [Chitinophagales bacterium]|nr:hypothetical protein [Chitinophagales bacterium]
CRCFGHMNAAGPHDLHLRSSSIVIAGQTAPKGRTMGHAGAIVGGKDDTAAAKMEIMRACGIHVAETPAVLGEKMREAIAR